MAPVYGSSRRAGVSGPWSMLRPGPRSALPRDLFWAPLSPLDNGALAGLIARAESVDDPPYRTTAEETAEYFVDPTYSGVAGRDALGVMRAFALVRLRPAGEIYASMVGVVDPDFRGARPPPHRHRTRGGGARIGGGRGVGSHRDHRPGGRRAHEGALGGLGLRAPTVVPRGAPKPDRRHPGGGYRRIPHHRAVG